MSLLDCIDVTLCVRLVQTLGHFLWQGVSVFLLLWLAMFLMRRSTSHARYTVSLLALLLMVICPSVTFMLIGQEDTASSPRVMMQSPVAPPSDSGIPGSESIHIPRTEPPAIVEAQAPLFDWQQLAPYFVMGYLLGVMIMLSRLLMALQGGRRLCRRSQPVDDPRLLRALAQHAKALGLSFTPAINYCRKIVAPTVIGVIRPMILLPISLSTGLSDEQIEVLLIHELAHIRRYDYLVNILQRMIEAVLFFHPGVWLISRRIRIERENCCDDLVLAGGIENLTYADTLIQIAEIVLASGTDRSLAAVAALGAADRSLPLLQRIQRLIECPTYYKPVRPAKGSSFALILIGLATILAAFQLAASGNYKGGGDLTGKPIADQNVYILGQVIHPGAYPIYGGEELTLKQLITTASVYDGEKMENATIMFSRLGVDGQRYVERKLGLITLSEDKGADVILRSGDLVTLLSEPLYRPQYHIALVVGADRMTFQGQDATCDTLPVMLQAVSNRPYTVLLVSKAEDNVPTAEQFNIVLRKANELVDEYGFQELFLLHPQPLGHQARYIQYVPIESMHYDLGGTIPVDKSLLQTYITDPPGRPRYAVRLVVGADCMTFQGQDATWDTLPAMFAAVPNRDQTVVEIARAYDSPPGDKFHDAFARTDKLQKQFGFEFMYPPGSRPLGAMGMLTRYIVDDGTMRTP